MAEKQENKKAIFSEEIDNSINGFALVLTFIGIGVFLTFNHYYFGNDMVSNVVRWIFIIIGSLGCLTEISDLRKNKDKGVKGLDDFIIGIILLGIWILIYYIVNNTICNSIGFIFLIFGSYGLIRGIIEIIYSIILNRKNNINKNTGEKNALIKDLLLILSQIAGIILIIIQIMQAFKVI